MKELTLDDGRRVGIPDTAAVFLANLEAAPDAKHPQAKALVRWSTGRGASVSFVRDPFRQVQNLFPRAVGGLGWTLAVDREGNDCAFPEGTIASYEEQPREDDAETPVFRISLNVETGPLELDVRTSFGDLKTMMGEKAPAPTEPAAPRRARRSRAK